MPFEASKWLLCVRLVMTDQRRSMDLSTLEAILILRYNHGIWDMYLPDGFEEPIESNADFDDYNAEDDSDEEEECVVMQVLEESADPLPVRHDADV